MGHGGRADDPNAQDQRGQAGRKAQGIGQAPHPAQREKREPDERRKENHPQDGAEAKGQEIEEPPSERGDLRGHEDHEGPAPLEPVDHTYEEGAAVAPKGVNVPMSRAVTV